MSAVEVLDRGELTLAELAAIANREYAAVISGAVAIFGRAVTCGEALIKARQFVEGDWEMWCAENLDFSPWTAKRWMRIAHYKDQLPTELFQPYKDAAGRHIQPSVSRVLKYLEVYPQLTYAPTRYKISPATVQEIQRLRNDGVTYEDIATLTGISMASVHRYVNPKTYERYKKKGRERRRRQLVAARALAIQEKRDARSVAAKAAGGSVGATWNLVLRAAQKGDAAMRAARDAETRLALSEALSYLHAAEDAIAKALKVP